MVKKKERRRILQDGDVINIQSEGNISIDDNNLPMPYNLPVSVTGAESPQRIFNDRFFHNGL